MPVDAVSLAQHYERDDVDSRALVRFAAGIGIGGLIAIGVLWLLLRAWTDRPLAFEVQIPPAEATVPAVPGPGLDAVPEVNLERTLQRDAERLNSYGWVDRAGGVVHIPIEEAMRMLVEQGLQARDGEAPDFQLEPAYRLDSSGGVTPAGEDRGFGDQSGEAPNGTDSGTEETGGQESRNEESSGDDTGSEESGGEGSGGEGSGEGEEVPSGSEPDSDQDGEEPGGAQSGS